MKLKKYIVFFLSLLLFASCANRGIGPQGGPKDSIPPVPLHSEPEIGALQFHGKRIEVTFNEYIQLDNVASNLIMSPPQQTPPDVKARGKRLIVQFQDSLRDSTTYTLDFGDAVCDYHEKVPLHGFSFYFSTGDEIDTLETTGQVYDAETLNPVKGIVVGIQDDLADSAFTTMPFVRIAKTDSAGFFRIGNIHPGIYRLYAIDDLSRDNRLTVGESLAFMDQTLTIKDEGPAPLTTNPLTPNPSSDSIPTDSLSTDTISLDSIALNKQFAKPVVTKSVLFLFKEEQQRLYLQRTGRDEQHRITFAFSSPPDSVMAWRVMKPSEIDTTKNDSAWIDPTPYIYTQYSLKGDTVNLWLTDSIAITQDSIFLEAKYRRTDSVYNLEWYTDTLRAIWRAPKLTAKMREMAERRNRNRRLDLRTNARRDFDIFDTLYIACATPLASIEPDSFHVSERSEAGLAPIPFTIAPYDTLPMKLQIIADFQPGKSYELQIDSAGLHDVYGTTHIRGTYPLDVKSLADYSTLRVKLNPFEPKARIQVLNSQDKVLRELPAVPEGAFFEYLKPDTYYLRLYIDENGDGKWTTGNWAEKRQPEPVFYFPEKIQTKSNWDFEEEWDYNAVPQTSSKPAAIKKVGGKTK